MNPPVTIGRYRLGAKLGEGGMGQVWRATDTRLGREVALKMLPAAFASDPGRMARFEREAQMLAALNHPNIAGIYGIEEGALVMEFVEGRDLQGPVPIDTALDYARQIATGLEAAHEKGMVHRDLKPANIKVTPEGVVKILDFGLAKTAEATSPNTNNVSESPTRSLEMTQAGFILGTAAYMSPEQARGKPVDRRADIWAFGAVFYEMLTGRQIFGGGETMTDTIASVVTREPDWTALPKDTPPHIRRLLERCLRKDVKTRLQAIGEARIALDEPPGAAPPIAEKRPRPLWWMLAAALPLAALAALSAIHFRESRPQPQVIRFQIPPPEGGFFSQSFMSLSPDGRQLAFVAVGKRRGLPQLWVRALDELEARALPGTENAYQPFWSPDSRFLAFLALDKVKKIEARGGPPETVCSLPFAGRSTGDWSSSGDIIFSGGAQGVFRVPQAGGDPVRITGPDAAQGETQHLYPQFLPDGRHYLYLALFAAPEKNAIYAGSLDGKEKKFLLRASQGFQYAPSPDGGKTGHVLFLREGALMAQALNPSTLTVNGDAFTAGALLPVLRSDALLTVSRNGTLAYRNVHGADRQLAWFDRSGKALGTLGQAGAYFNVALSRDGKRAAFLRMDAQTANRDLWLMDAGGGAPFRFTFDEAEEWDPVWSPDGRRLAFSSNRDGPYALYVKDSSGAAKEEQLRKSDASERPCDWSGDGRFLMFTRGAPGSMKLWVLSDPEDPAKRKQAPYLDSPFNVAQGQFMPGSAGPPRWVAYGSDESRHERDIYVQSFPPGAGKFQVSTAGGSQPRWRRDGKELFYIAPDGQLMAVDVKTEPRFELGAPHALFDSGVFLATAANTFRYDVTPDGQRFLIIVSRENRSDPDVITVVVNWAAGLKPAP